MRGRHLDPTVPSVCSLAVPFHTLRAGGLPHRRSARPAAAAQQRAGDAERCGGVGGQLSHTGARTTACAAPPCTPACSTTPSRHVLACPGVNRHEHDQLRGKTISLESMVRDICLMKRLNFNAVRCSHYPNHTLWWVPAWQRRQGMLRLDPGRAQAAPAAGVAACWLPRLFTPSPPACALRVCRYELCSKLGLYVVGEARAGRRDAAAPAETRLRWSDLFPPQLAPAHVLRAPRPVMLPRVAQPSTPPALPCCLPTPRRGKRGDARLRPCADKQPLEPGMLPPVAERDSRYVAGGCRCVLQGCRRCCATSLAHTFLAI